LTGWDVVRGFCRDAGEYLFSRYSRNTPADLMIVLWNMRRGSRLSRPSIRSAIKILWVDWSMFEKYAVFAPYNSVAETDFPYRTAKPNHDSLDLQREDAADTREPEAVSAADLEVVQWVVLVVDKSMSPTFVSNPLFFVFVYLC
jgi:hypothetical protein